MPLGAKDIILFNSEGSSDIPKTAEEIVKDKLKFLLETNKGEIVDDLEYGANLIDMVHLPRNEALIQSMLLYIQMAITEYMPYVNIVALDLDSTRTDHLAFRLAYSLQEGFEDKIDNVV